MRAQLSIILFCAQSCHAQLGNYRSNSETSSATCDLTRMVNAAQDVTASCCLPGECELGLPQHCSATCAPVFLNFWTDYGESCDDTLSSLPGLSTVFDRLRQSCEAAGGLDDREAKASDCGVAAVMPAMQFCALADLSDTANFCSGACHSALEPLMNRCGTRLESDETVALIAGEAMSAIHNCQLDQDATATAGNGRSCQMEQIAFVCSTDPMPSVGTLDDPSAICENPCFQQFANCVDSPELASSGFSAENHEALQILIGFCDGRGSQADGPAPSSHQHADHDHHYAAAGSCTNAASSCYGDGFCQMQLLGPCENAIDSMLREPDFDRRCNNDCARELADCANDPLISNPRMHAIVNNLVDSCISPMTTDLAGDGICQLVNLAQICPAHADHATMEAMCNSGCVAESMECADRLQITDQQRTNMAGWAAMCEHEECSALIPAFPREMRAHGCCPNDPGGTGDLCGNSLPETCTAECAELAVPFLATCGTTLETMLATERHDLLVLENFEHACTEAQRRHSAGGAH
eukprot:SAG31_NODE_344_length_17385_cov_58.217575_3_plen_526_part_00